MLILLIRWISSFSPDAVMPYLIISSSVEVSTLRAASMDSRQVFAGISLPKVQMILRHKSLNTTMIYAAAWERYNNDGEQILADIIFKE